MVIGDESEEENDDGNARQNPWQLLQDINYHYHNDDFINLLQDCWLINATEVFLATMPTDSPIKNLQYEQIQALHSF